MAFLHVVRGMPWMSFAYIYNTEAMDHSWKDQHGADRTGWHVRGWKGRMHPHERPGPYMHCIRFHSCPCTCICTIHIIYIESAQEGQKLYQPRERVGKDTIKRDTIRSIKDELVISGIFQDIPGEDDTIRFYWKGPPSWTDGSDLSVCCVNVH